jgi:hypothetical protein
MDIAVWLRGLGLKQYEPAFRDNDRWLGAAAADPQRPEGYRRRAGWPPPQVARRDRRSWGACTGANPVSGRADRPAADRQPGRYGGTLGWRTPPAHCDVLRCRCSSMFMWACHRMKSAFAVDVAQISLAGATETHALHQDAPSSIDMHIGIEAAEEQPSDCDPQHWLAARFRA